MTIKFQALVTLFRVSFAILLVELILAAIFGRLVMLETLSGALTLLTVALTEYEVLAFTEAPVRQISGFWTKLWQGFHVARCRMSWGSHLVVVGVVRVFAPIVLLGLLALVGFDRRLNRHGTQSDPHPPDKEMLC